MAAISRSDLDYCIALVITNVQNLLLDTLRTKFEVCIFINVYEEAICRAETYLKNFDTPNILKVAGYYTYWFRKLKPFILEDKQGKNTLDFLYLNEFISLFFGITLLAQKTYLGNRKPNLTEEFINDLVVSYRYNNFSPQSITMLYAALNETWHEVNLSDRTESM